ncbi:MAG TPA: CHAD domain-containing protein [Acidobacteriaceae bacterium]|nr:CHAD domain-containing protein [Acidobacteriaceae bacterium]
MAFDLNRVHKDIRKLKGFLKSWPKHAMPEDVHSLRTTTRRFEAAMQALSLDSKGNEKRLLRRMSKLRRRAGKVRDLDVLTGYVADLDVSGEDECMVQLLEYLGAEHADRSQRLYSYAVKHSGSLRRRLDRTASDLKAFSKDIVLASTASGNAMLSELRIQRELTAPDRFTKANLHPYRLQVKELRYMLQMEEDPADQQLVGTLGQVKDAIGEWHDWQELVAIARENLPHGKRCKLIPLLQKTTQKKLHKAISVANAGRRQIHSSPAATIESR